MMNWGIHVKKLRKDQRLTQWELASKSGLTRSHICAIEMGRVKSVKRETLAKLARGLGISLDYLTKEVYGLPSESLSTETPEQVLEHLKMVQAVSIPVYKDFPFHAGEPVDPDYYIYLPRQEVSGKNIEAYVVEGKCLEPALQDRDIIVLDRDAEVKVGDIVACATEDGFIVGKLRKIGDVMWVANGHISIKYQDCTHAAPVIWVNRRLK